MNSLSSEPVLPMQPAQGADLARVRGSHLIHVANAFKSDGLRREALANELVSCNHAELARQEIQSWPGYRITPVMELSGLAAHLGLGEVWLKDEGTRFGIGSFKALGGGYAVFRLLAARLRALGIAEITRNTQLQHPDAQAQIAGLTVACATDGNHGRAVAWAAREFGCQCMVYIHAGVSSGREAALRKLGATVVRITGTYDDSVRQVAADAQKRNWILVADTSMNIADESPKYVMAGYTVLLTEVLVQLALRQPTHILVQTGVGGLAAAIATGLCAAKIEPFPRLVTVDPIAAACVFQSIAAGKPTAARGDLATVMAGLACGEVSVWAWPTLRAAVSDALAIEDAGIAPTMRLMLSGAFGDPGMEVGESGVAGIAALISAGARPEVMSRLGLDSTSRVLLIATEGVTDPEIFDGLVSNAG